MPSRLHYSQEKQRAKKKHPPNVIYVVNIIIILLFPAMLINSSLLSVADSLQKNGTIEPVWFNMRAVFSFRTSSLYKNSYHLSNHVAEEKSQGILLFALILNDPIVLSFR